MASRSGMEKEFLGTSEVYYILIIKDSTHIEVCEPSDLSDLH